MTTVPNPTFLALALVAEGLWLLATLLLWRSHLPARPPADPETTELGAESPAVVNLLTHGWRVTQAAAPATLLDLAARRIITIDWVGDSYICRLRPRARHGALLPYETRVLGLVRSHMVDGVVPAAALDTGAPRRARRWWRAFTTEIVSEAKALGLSRDAWDERVTLILGVFGAVAIGLGLLAGLTGTRSETPGPWSTVFGLGYIAAIPLVLATLSLGQLTTQRDTPAGLTAAARWLGVRRVLAEDGTFPTLPPPGVAMWDRYLAYAAALGVAKRSLTGLPLIPQDDHRAWVLRSGQWRQVRVWYPRLPGWGKDPRRVFVRSLPLTMIAVAGFAAMLDPARDFPWFGVPILAALAAFAAWHFAAAVLATLDLGRPAKVQGCIVRLRERPRFSLSYSADARYRWYVAVDDGRSDTLWAWSIPRGSYERLDEGQIVIASVTRRLRHVASIASVD